MDATTQAPVTKVRLPLHERYAGFIVWFSLFCSVVGLLGAFHDLIHDLIRFSLLTKALVAAYHIVRNGLWNEIRTAFSWAHISLPDIPDVWKDALSVSSLVLTALNFESVRHHKKTLPAAFAESLATNFRILFLDDENAQYRGLFAARADEDWSVTVFMAWILGFWVDGYLVHLLAAASGAGASNGGVALFIFDLSPASIGFILAVFTFAAMEHGELLGKSALGRIILFISSIFYFFPAALVLPFLALYNGRRAVLFAIGLVAFMITLNYCFVHSIDPALEHPPAFLQRLIDADPDSLSATPTSNPSPVQRCRVHHHCGP